MLRRPRPLAVFVCLGSLPVASVGAQKAEAPVTVPGLAAPAQILIDPWGVPHLYAATADDLFFVQGFNAARDRL